MLVGPAACTTSTPDIQAIGSWARYLDLGTQADDQESCFSGELLYRTSRNPSVVQALFGELVYIYLQPSILSICVVHIYKERERESEKE